MVKKIFSAFLVLTLAISTLSIFPNSADATNHPSWRWKTEYISQFQTVEVAYDERCDNDNPAFRVTLFEGGNFTGARAKICGYWDDLSQLPQFPGSSKTFNNSVSSYKVTFVPGGYAVQFNSGKDQEGPVTWVRGEGSVNEAGGDVDNILSSLKRINP